MSISLPKIVLCIDQIGREMSDIMLTVDASGRTAAFKNRFCFKITCFDLMRLKKGYRKKGNLLHGLYCISVNLQIIQVGCIDRILTTLVRKNTNCMVSEFLVSLNG